MKQLIKPFFSLLFGLMACIGLTFAQSAPQPFKITGTIKGNTQIVRIVASVLNNSLGVITKGSYGKGKIINAEVKNGQYTLSGTITEPCIMRLAAYGKEEDADFDYGANEYILLLVPGNVVLVSNKTLGNIQVSGNGAYWDKDYHYMVKQLELKNQSFQNLGSRQSNLFGKMDNYKKGRAAASYGAKEYALDSIQYAKSIDTALTNKLEHVFGSNILLPYVKKYPSSPVGLWALLNLSGVGDSRNEEILDYYIQSRIFKQLSPQVKALTAAKAFKERLATNGILQIGKIAPDFTLPDTLGQRLSLSSLRGKYVLVDFWASWCVPCREEFPNLRNVYSKYKDKNFTIFGVEALTPMNSIDVIRWKQAIVADESHWLHVFDEKKAVGKLYGVTSIPTNYLLDPNGAVIAKNISGKDLEKKLKELLGE